MNSTKVLRERYPNLNLHLVDRTDDGRYYRVHIQRGSVKQVESSLVLPQHRDGSRAYIYAVLYNGNLLLQWPELSRGAKSDNLSIFDPNKRMAPVPVAGFQGAVNSSRFQWNADRKLAILSTSGSTGGSYLYSIRVNRLTPLPKDYGYFFWQPRHQHKDPYSLVCAKVRQTGRGFGGILAVKDWTFFLLRCTQDGTTLSLTSLPPAQVDALFGSAYRHTILGQGNPLLENIIGYVTRDVLIHPSGRIGIASNILNRLPDRSPLDENTPPEEGAEFPPPVTEKDWWQYYVSHGASHRFWYVKPSKYIRPIDWFDERRIIGQQTQHDYQEFEGRSFRNVVWLDPLTWRSEVIYRPHGSVELIGVT